MIPPLALLLYGRLLKFSVQLHDLPELLHYVRVKLHHHAPQRHWLLEGWQQPIKQQMDGITYKFMDDDVTKYVVPFLT